MNIHTLPFQSLLALAKKERESVVVGLLKGAIEVHEKTLAPIHIGYLSFPQGIYRLPMRLTEGLIRNDELAQQRWDNVANWQEMGVVVHPTQYLVECGPLKHPIYAREFIDSAHTTRVHIDQQLLHPFGQSYLDIQFYTVEIVGTTGLCVRVQRDWTPLAYIMGIHIPVEDEQHGAV